MVKSKDTRKKGKQRRNDSTRRKRGGVKGFDNLETISPSSKFDAETTDTERYDGDIGNLSKGMPKREVSSELLTKMAETARKKKEEEAARLTEQVKAEIRENAINAREQAEARKQAEAREKAEAMLEQVNPKGYGEYNYKATTDKENNEEERQQKTAAEKSLLEQTKSLFEQLGEGFKGLFSYKGSDVSEKTEDGNEVDR